MDKPRFTTLLKQAKEQCEKAFASHDILYFPSEMVIKFFASGMEYRMSHTHIEAERAVLSLSDPEEFLKGYLQGKSADPAMLKAIEKDCDKLLIDSFTKGLFFEEAILEKGATNTSARRSSSDVLNKSHKVCLGHFLREPKTGFLWLHTSTRDTEFIVNTNVGKLDLANCNQVDAKIVSAPFFGIFGPAIELIVAQNQNGNYAVFAQFMDTLGEGGLYASITPGFTFKTVFCFNEDLDIYIIGEDLEGNWGIIRSSWASTMQSGPWITRSTYMLNEIVRFKHKNIQKALRECPIAADKAANNSLIELTKPTDMRAQIDKTEQPWGTTLYDIMLVRHMH